MSESEPITIDVQPLPPAPAPDWTVLLAVGGIAIVALALTATQMK